MPYSFLIIIWLTLLVSPPAVYVILRRVIPLSKDRKKLAIILLGICLINCLGLLFGLSLSVDIIDCILLCVIYFTITFLLVWAFRVSTRFLKILTGIAMFSIFALGYLLGTIGLLGLLIVLGEAIPEQTFHFPNNITIKQYNLGFATSEYRGVELTFFKNYKWLPLIEHEAFTKRYDISGGPTHKQMLDNYNFHVGYDTSKHAVIISDKTHRYEVTMP